MKKKKHNRPQKKLEPQPLYKQVLQSLDKTGGSICKERPAWKVYLCAFLLPFFILTLFWLFAGVIFGDSMILAHDQWHQYYPFYLDFQRKLQQGGSMFYSWTNGMGTNYLSMFSYYLASPMNFLVGLLPQSWALGFYTFCVMVKISLGGLFCAVFLRKLYDRRDLSVIFFSTLYAFCAFICGYYWNAIWLDTVALLPLVALGTVYLLRDGKFILYTSMLALSILCSYYVGLFTCIFVLLIYLCYEICTDKNWAFLVYLGVLAAAFFLVRLLMEKLGLGDWWLWAYIGFAALFTLIFCICTYREGYGFGARLLRIAFFSALGIGITAALSLPAFLGLQATSSAVNKFPTEFRLNIVKDNTFLGVLDGLRQIISQLGTGITPTSMEGLPNIACGTVTFVLSLGFFCSKKVKLREKLCCAGLLLFFCMSFLIRQLDYIWHGFHFPNMLPYRFSFLFSFVLIYMAFRTFTELPQWKWYYILFIAPVAVVFLFCVLTNQSHTVTALTAGFTLLAFGLLFLYSKKWLSKNLLVLCLCALFVVESVIGMVKGSKTVGYTSESAYPTAGADVQQVLSVMDGLEEGSNDIWRAEMTLTQTLNDNALNGYNGITTFSSAANCGVSQFMKSIGLPASVAGNRYAYEESTPLTNLLVGLKYMIDRDNLSVERPFFDNVSSSGTVQLLKNRAYLPVGFMVSDRILSYDAESRSGVARITNQNYLYQLLSGSQGNLLEQVNLAEHSADENVVVKGSGSQFQISNPTSGKNGKAHFTFRITETCHFCVYTSQSSLNNKVYVELNGSSLTNYATKYGYLRDFGTLHAGDELTFSISAKDQSTEGTFTIYAGKFDDEAFDRLFRRLSGQTMQATNRTDTDFEGTIKVTQSGICYLSIPYDKGWSATVDGEPVSTVAVFGAFIGIPLEPGRHTVSLHYETPGFRLGLYISLGCLAVFLLLAVISLLRRAGDRPLKAVSMEMLGSTPAAKKGHEALPQEPIPDAPEWTDYEVFDPSAESLAVADSFVQELPAEESTSQLPSIDDATQVVPVNEVTAELSIPDGWEAAPESDEPELPYGKMPGLFDDETDE